MLGGVSDQAAKAAPCCRLGGAVALALGSRQAAGCLQSVLSVLGSEREAPEGSVCAASASATHCCTYNCFQTNASLVLCQEEEGKLELQRNIRGKLQNPLFPLG